MECKTSRADFYADKKKYFGFRHKENGWVVSSDRAGKKRMEEQGYEQIELSRMGDYRFFLCEPFLITEEMISAHAPDHGLLYMAGHRIKMARPAIRRALVDKDGEIRYLRFSIVNGKTPYVPSEEKQIEQGT